MIAPRLAAHYADRMNIASFLCSLALSLFLLAFAAADDSLPKACIDGNGPGWRSLGEADFVNVNCAADTWSFKDGKIQCTGTPTGVMRMKEPVTNFELVVQWMHQKPGGNSGVCVWASEESIKNLHGGLHRRRRPDGSEGATLD